MCAFTFHTMKVFGCFHGVIRHLKARDHINYIVQNKTLFMCYQHHYASKLVEIFKFGFSNLIGGFKIVSSVSALTII